MKNWQDMIDVDFPPCTEKRHKNLKMQLAMLRIFRGCGARMGRIMTSEDVEERRQRAFRRNKDEDRNYSQFG